MMKNLYLSVLLINWVLINPPPPYSCNLILFAIVSEKRCGESGLIQQFETLKMYGSDIRLGILTR